MKDPYQILNVPPNASNDEIKKSYRELARKYHPDNYHDSPLEDLAQEKMKEINEAYDSIMKMRSGGQGGGSSYGGAHYGGQRSYYHYQAGGSPYQRVRMAINQNRFADAEQILNSIQTHDAEWHYLSGVLYYRKGWVDEAAKHIDMACSMDPNNQEYRQAQQVIQNGGAFRFRPGGAGFGPAECCSTLCCLNLCCPCC